MTLYGWIMMLGSIGCVLALNAFCFWKVLGTPRSQEHIHGPLDIDTHDRDT